MLANNQSITSLEDASQAIQGLQLAIKKTMQEMFRLAVESGRILEWVYEQLHKAGKYTEWVLSQGISLDTASNYRKVYKHFSGLLLLDEIPPLRLNDLYCLSLQAVSNQAREWFIEQVKQESLDVGIKDLVTIARYSPDAIFEWFSRGLINRHQMQGLADAYSQKNLDSYVVNICLELQIKWGYIVTELNRLYLDYQRTPDSKQVDKTWHEIEHNQFVLVWDDNVVPLKDATRLEFTSYMNSRVSDHMLEKSPIKHKVDRFKVSNVDGKRVIEIDDYFVGEIVGITIILKEGE